MEQRAAVVAAITLAIILVVGFLAYTSPEFNFFGASPQPSPPVTPAPVPSPPLTGQDEQIPPAGAPNEPVPPAHVQAVNTTAPSGPADYVIAFAVIAMLGGGGALARTLLASRFSSAAVRR